MTPLGKQLLARIAAGGLMSVADFMSACLTDPRHGYYTTGDPLGRAGDFITAPEISQMFGELIGLVLAQAWMDQGRPERIILAELGPGRGTLMADALRAAAKVPGFARAVDLHLVELSPVLRERQKEALAAFDPKWHAQAADLPEGPLYLIANEFFDALPIRQFQRDPSGWSERMIGAEGEHLVMGLSPPTPLAALDHRLEDTAPGDIVELCTPASAIMTGIATRISASGGVALVLDYGDWRSLGDTLQTLAEHRRSDPLSEPGRADLTAHVDFEPLALAARDAGAAHTRLTPQGVFLERLGIAQRAERLAARLSGAALEGHLAAHRRLTAPDEMGTLFKAMAIHPQGSALPAGFAP